MKKLFVMAIVAVAAMTVISCGNKAPKANLENDIDTLSYAIGMAQTNGLNQYLAERLGVDTTYADEFVKGLLEGANAGDDKKQAAYYAGIQIGQQISNQMVKGINAQLFGADSTKTISLKNFLAGFISGYKNEKGNMTMQQAEQIAEAKMMELQQKAQQEQMKKMEAEAIAKYGENKKAGEKFLAENAKKEGVVTTKSGVQYKVIKEGNGAKPTAQSTVSVFYELKLIDGTVVETNFGKEPATFPLQGVIKGWQEALQLMPVGSTYEIYIPQDLAYGPQDQGKIKPFSALVFKVELKEVK